MPGREVFLATCVALCVLCGSKVSVDARKTNYVLPNKVVPESHANTYVTVQTTCRLQINILLSFKVSLQRKRYLYFQIKLGEKCELYLLKMQQNSIL